MMNAMLQALEYVPAPIRMMLLGGLLFAGAEIRYMTVADFTKSYVLDLKSEIREIRKDLTNPNLSSEHRDDLEEQLQQLLDDLCYETDNKDLYCKDR